ncbi:MAG: hypothetical protein ACJA1H_001107 [Glaciecola sp.]|jgi:hypothetical protein
MKELVTYYIRNPMNMLHYISYTLYLQKKQAQEFELFDKLLFISLK